MSIIIEILTTLLALLFFLLKTLALFLLPNLLLEANFPIINQNTGNKYQYIILIDKLSTFTLQLVIMFPVFKHAVNKFILLIDQI